MVRIFFVLIFFSLNRIFVNAQYGACDYSATITAVNPSTTANYLASAGPCRYKVYAPADWFITAVCNITLQDNTCKSQQFVVSRSGEGDLKDGLAYCGSRSLNIRSIGNELVVVIRTSIATGSFNCKFTAVAPTNNNCDCGWNAITRIVGGTPTKVNEFVSHAGLVNTLTKEVFCGAVIIQQYWSLTAAHCIDAYPNIGTTVLLVGDHDISIGTETKWAAVYTLSTYRKHSGYVASTNLNDIALVKTANYIRYNPGVGPGCLPYTFNGVSFENNILTAVGWGHTSFAGEPSKVLMKAGLNVISNQQCSVIMPNIDSTKVCTQGGSKDTCSNDSGGGLYWFAGRYYPIAIVNYGKQCASRYPSVNSRINNYIGWIESNAGGFFCRK